MDADHDKGARGFTRRMALGAGTAAAVGIMASPRDGLAQDDAPRGAGKMLARMNASDPIITVDFSDMKASLEDGVKWVLDSIPTVDVKASELGNLKKVLSFVKPNGDKIQVPITFNTGFHLSMAAPMASAALPQDTLQTVLAVYKIAQQLDGALLSRGGAYASAAVPLFLDGMVGFTYGQIAMSRDGEARLAKARNASGDLDTVSLNVSNLIGVPTQGIPTKNFQLRRSAPIEIPQIFVDDDHFAVTHQARLTEDGSNIYATTLDVKKLLGISAASRAAMTARFGGVNISASDLATIVQVASWALGAADNRGRIQLAPSLVSGSISISVGVGF